ncbi:uncharacterized protein [Haliotis cracherodii]|uniref:uncharacterized protein isoform X2 n=1 Tax=Haliotis cracherodii TaxID=6455 RepID=UPI0039E7A16F
MADYDDLEDNLYRRLSQGRVARRDDYEDRVSGYGIDDGSGRGGRRSLERQPRDWRDDDLDDRSPNLSDRSWDARSRDARSRDARSWDARSWDARSRDARSRDDRDWDEGLGDRREPDYDRRSGDRDPDQGYMRRRDRDFDDGFGDPIDLDQMSDDPRDWGEMHHDEMSVDDLDWNIHPVREGRGHSFIPGEDDLDTQGRRDRSMRAGRHQGQQDQPWVPEEEPVLPFGSTMEEWNELKSDVPTKTIMLSGLPRITRESDVYLVLQGFHHEIKDLQIETSQTGNHDGVAFIDFFEVKQAVQWMGKIQTEGQGSVEILKCEVKAVYSSLVLQSTKTVFTWRKWASTVPTDTLVVWNIPPNIGFKAIRDEITLLGVRPIKVMVMKCNDTGKSREYGIIGFQSVAEAYKFMDITKGVIELTERTMLAMYSSGGKQDKNFTAPAHSTKTVNKKITENTQMPGGTEGGQDGEGDEEKDGIDSEGGGKLNTRGTPSKTLYVANVPSDASWKNIKLVFQLAGEVLKVQKNVNSNFAIVRFKTTEEAVQAISMFDGQKLFDCTMKVSFYSSKERAPVVKALPTGSKSQDPGLDACDEPSDNIPQTSPKNSMDIVLIGTKRFFYEPSTDKYYKKKLLRKCPVPTCGLKKPQNWKNLSKHWLMTHTPTKRKYSCPIEGCKQTSPFSVTQLRLHLPAEHHVSKQDVDQKVQTAKVHLVPNEKFCDPGNIVLPRPTQAKGPQLKIPKTKCPVENCPHSYTTMASMQQHWSNYHRASVKMYCCNLCNDVMKGKSLIQQHLEKKHAVDFHDSRWKLVEWENQQFIDPGDVIPFWNLYTTKEEEMSRQQLEKELGKDFPLVDIPMQELERSGPGLYDFYEWTENYMHRLQVAQKYALEDLQKLTRRALEEN